MKWKSWIQTEHEALRSVTAILSRNLGVRIEIDKEGVRSWYDRKEKKIVLGTGELWKHGADAYTGLALHEVGHARFSPPAKIEKKHEGLYNLLEDRRIEELMTDEYDGADYFLKELNEGPLRDFERDARKPRGKVHLHDLLSLDWTDKDKLEGLPHYQRTTTYKKLINERKRDIFHRVLRKAVLIYRGRDPFGSTTGSDETDEMAADMARLLQQAQYAEAKEIPELTAKAARILAQVLPEPDDEQDGEGGQGKEAGKGNTTLEQIAGHGHGYSEPSAKGYVSYPGSYVAADARILPLVSKMKTTLIRHLRETERLKYEGGKRKGTVDKKKLHRVASKRFRVFHKRILPKGKDYSVQIVVDCSGSMFSDSAFTGSPVGRNGRMGKALSATALLARAFRSIGYETGITAFGAEAIGILDPRDLYRPEDIGQKLENSSGKYWNSSDNEANQGITVALKRMNPRKHRLMVLITDGGFYGSDIELSRKLLRKEMQHGDFTPILFFIDEDDECVRILEDTDHEQGMTDINELIPAAAQLVRSIVITEE